ncbi:MAG TPA: hypothetical protein PKD09_05110 [Aggregatilinea sp.]|uniref:hypothetical protein n=1 Tax=Aggregatilinea sp. TaxID=2806333 RepID=UPI002BA5529C|nr:hypothetical protein [Aggregatilinea sp.]HML21005.1 hypothetical protein [Aggregatilinea sp.]
MIEQLQYHTIEELRALSLDELRALWELVPTDRQHRYQMLYQREVRINGASGSDALEQQIVTALIQRYADGALVPIGARWARTPIRIQNAARLGEVHVTPEAEYTPPAPKRTQALLIFSGAGLFLIFFVFFLLSRLGGDDSKPTGEAGDDSPYATPTLRYTPSPTPIALEEQDVIIRDGVRDRAPAYPVNLQILPAGQTQPRVFVVQRRKVELSEWLYDPNPDTASFIQALSVRPVIGVPWSPQNEALFESLGPGATFSIRLNTGAVQQFDFASKTQVSRSDTSAFRQIEPGLVLVLIGERDERGAPTASRLLVLATYPPEQELSRDDVLVADLLDLPVVDVTPAPPAPTATPLPARDLLHVDVISVVTVDQRITVQLRAYNGQSEPADIRPENIAITFGYAPRPPGPWMPAEGLGPFMLLPGQAVDLTLHWAWAGEPYAKLIVGASQYAIQLTPG